MKWNKITNHSFLTFSDSSGNLGDYETKTNTIYSLFISRNYLSIR